MVKKVINIEELVIPAKCKIVGDIYREFYDVKSITEASSGDLTFCSRKGKEAISLIKRSKASVIICNIEIPFKDLTFNEKTVVAVNNPRLWFIRCINAFFPSKVENGIHPTVIIGKNCQIDDDVYIGPYVCIHDDVIIRSGTKIYSGVHIFEKVKIGKNVIIKSGCVIGSDGFGHERNEMGILERFPQRAGVLIEDNVEIGANTCIDRGTLSDTVIGEGTKIDNLVHVAHNVHIGKHCGIVALSLIGGSTSIGDYSRLAPCACIRDSVSIGKHVLVGMGAVVTKDVNDKTIVYGVPAKPKI